jgi:hypothetical protein
MALERPSHAAVGVVACLMGSGSAHDVLPEGADDDKGALEL